MTKFILTIVCIALIFLGGWMLHKEWSKYSSGADIKEDEAAAGLVVNPQSLPGMPNGLEQSYSMAEQAGVTGLKNWLKMYGDSVQDPRRAWIELDYMVLIARTDPAEAKKYPRIRQLAKTYE